MEHDDGLSLADKFSGSNSEGDDDDGIDSDLEGKLYSAVFHSNDISSQSQHTSEYTNKNSLTDVINSWTNISKKNNSQSSKISDDNVFGESNVHRRNNEVILLDFTDDDDNFDCNGEISGYGNLVDDSMFLKSSKTIKDQICLENIKSNEILADKEQGINIASRTEIDDRLETQQSKYMVRNIRESIFNGKNILSDKKMMKKQKISATRSMHEDSRIDNSGPKSSGMNDTAVGSNTCSGNYLRDELARVSVTADGAETSEIKTEDELEETAEGIETSSRVSSVTVETGAAREDLDRPPSIKPEDEFEKDKPVDHEVLEAKANGISDVKPKEVPTDKIQSAETEGVTNLNNSLSSDSSSEDSSSTSSVEKTQNNKISAKSERISRAPRQRNDVITLDDSEDSISEIPVPPKPRPPTINIDDSASTISSDSDTDSETMSPQKLVESYKIAVSESNSRGEKSAESTSGNNNAQNSSNLSSNYSKSDGDDSMTESEEENWGIIAGNQMSKTTPIRGSFRDEIIENFTMEVEQESDGCTIIENRDMQLVSEENENEILERRKRTYDKLSLERTSALEGQSENNDKENSQGIDNNLAQGDTLMINAGIISNLLTNADNVESKRSAMTSESRKRSMTDSGKKSKQHNSPKKAKNSENSGIAGSSNDKIRRENQENKDKQKSSPADYFFEPITNETENDYNRSWRGEEYDLDTIKSQMPRDPRYWAILNEDLLGNQQRRSRYWTESKCRNCNRKGHRVTECSEKKKIPCCHMCGASGHKEPRCPHKMCLNCGKKQKTYMQVCNECRNAWCAGCQSYGHWKDQCPDLWRRYHLTTSFKNINTQLNAADIMKPQHLLSCCNCAQRGHDSTTCGSYRWSKHFPTPAYVSNYTTGPTYVEDFVRGDNAPPSETTDQNEMEIICYKSPASHERKKRKSRADKITSENLETVEITETTNNTVDRTIDKLKEQNKSDGDKIHKSHDVAQKNSKPTTKDGEILFTIKSETMDDQSREFSTFVEHIVPLLEEHYVALTEANLGREFLKNLTTQFSIKLEIKRYENSGLAMTITSPKNLHDPIRLTIMDWLKWPVEERSRFVNLTLPKPKQDLLKLLSSKLKELNEYLGDPITLHKTIQSLKADLRNFQRSSKSGKKGNSRRARVSEELAKSQCKLNMILHGQLKIQRFEKSCNYLRRFVKSMRKPNSPSWIGAPDYLQILHHYNKIFAAYTPDDIQNLLDHYLQKTNTKVPSRKRNQLSVIKSRDPTNSRLNESINQSNKHLFFDNSSLAGMNVSINTNNQTSQLSVNNDTRDTFNYSENYKDVQNQFVPPETVTNFDFNFKRPPNYPPPLMSCNTEMLQKNYYNCRYNFGRNPGSRRQGIAKPIHKNEDFIALESQSLKNNYHNIVTDFDNHNFNETSRGRDVDRYTIKNFRKDERMENDFTNYYEANNQDDSFVGRNVWQDNYGACNTSSEVMFTTDTQGEPLKNYSYNDKSNVSLKNDVIGPSIPGPRDNNCPATEQQKIRNKNKNKKKKKNRGPSLSQLQKRAEKSIAKYEDLGFPRAIQATKKLRARVENKDVTLNCVKRFERVIKRRIKKNKVEKKKQKTERLKSSDFLT